MKGATAANGHDPVRERIAVLETALQGVRELATSNDKRYEERHVADVQALQAALAAAEKAVTTALTAQEKSATKTEEAQREYNTQHNDLIRKMDTQHKETLPRIEGETRFTSMDEKNEARFKAQDERMTGLNSTIQSLLISRGEGAAAKQQVAESRVQSNWMIGLGVFGGLSVLAIIIGIVEFAVRVPK